MSNPLDEKLKKIESNLKAVLHKAPRAIGTMAAAHFRDNFSKQGFDDNGVQSWPRRKKERKGDEDRAVLTKSGRLRRSTRLARYNTREIVIANREKYAAVHNEGGIIYRKPYGQRTGATRTYKGREYAVKRQIRATAYKMPRRRFIGHSASLNRKVNEWYKRHITKALKV